MILKFFCFTWLLLSTQFSLAQNSQSYHQFQIIDQISQEPIPYAHISINNRLIAISDYSGYFSIQAQQELESITISSVGYLKKILPVEHFATNGKSIIIKLSPSNQELNEVVVTPNSLKSLIAEIYREIPNKYYSKPHKLIGNYQEFYKDTSNNINANINSKIEVIKDSYRNKNKKGVVKIKEYKRDISDSSKFEHLIGAGPHIPHRFDFVMRRDEFINPDRFNQYKYTFIKEVMYNNRLLDVIKFEPKKSIFGSSFYGKIFIDSKEKVFLKAEYNYTNYGFLVNRHSNWAKQRKFITEYKKQNGMWHLYYTWDEAVSKTNNFKLTQEFYTNTISLDTLKSHKAIDKINYKDAFLLKEDTNTINTNISKEEIVKRLLEQNKTLKILSKLEFSFDLKALIVNNRNFT